MTRLASTAKAGFFPTPERVTEWIARCVSPSQAQGKLLDPCCGEGIAAQCLASAWNLEAYGIEIDAERVLEASSRLHRVLHLDYAQTRTPHHAFQVLFLNPPYDFAEGEGKRAEYQFLRDTTKWLQPGGLLVYIVPQYRVDARMAGFLATAYEVIRAYRFPDPEYAQFRQAVIFGIGKKEPSRDDASSLALLQQCRNGLPVLPESPSAEERYALSTFSEDDRFYFRGTEINPQDALAEAIAAGAWNSSEWQAWLTPTTNLSAFRPLMPLKKGHLAMLIAAGLMQNLLLTNEQMTNEQMTNGQKGQRLLVKGRTYKVQEQVQSDDEDEEILRDRFVTEIVALDLTSGEHERIAESSALAQFVEEWRDALTNKVMETFVPLYRFDLEAEGERVLATLNRLSKHRYVPGRKETGLFPAQKHVAVALWKRLRNANSAICVGEPGIGKTTVATAVSELMRECEGDTRPTLVLCPPHLVPKWVREIQQIVPMAFAMPLNRLSDVATFVRQLKRLAPGTPAYAVLSREMAKLGGGWRPATVIHKKYLRVEEDGEETSIETETLFACPRCGHPVHEVEGGQEIVIVRDAGYFEERKRFCFKCHEPLYQMIHLGGATQRNRGNGNGHHSERLIDGESKPVTQRYPIAEFIARRYPGYFKLLIADEVHQMKGQSTDQGYALGALVRGCSKTLALTGTIYGGRATSLFFLLHRLSPRVRTEFKWNDGQKWAERYGILLRRVGVR
jgi:predicted RNA methylase